MTHFIVFFDIDGTLVDSQGKVTNETRQAIQQLKGNGHLPVVCTGRGRGELGSIMADAGIETAILLNGMELVHNNELIFQGHVAVELVAKLKGLSSRKGHELGYYSDGAIKVECHSRTMKQNFKHFHQSLPQLGDSIASRANCQMLLLFSSDSSLDQFYMDNLPQLTFARNSPYSLDVTPKGWDKGTGIRHLMEILDLAGPTVAFGDGLNDLSMFSVVDRSIAMGNAKKEVKEMADRVTLTNDQGGIPVALQELGLV
ncbi:Hydrolase (HAD superfamily) in cluster with DUF1447 [Streptococcus sp. DD10]|uniref:Cof-type HAD-IIB family hydrolase n=1 Tax=Streptococcus sp. DD10 TaxID=1777878 RepID=UPI000799B95B|nr:Cof-type HAD-IIB family hydrolase [Streptococcus sp. DD10]KXT74428.1 Hydrolase (HAD superfamily) in cluster with DUF1447 [Streptococcus sp. DD10]